MAVRSETRPGAGADAEPTAFRDAVASMHGARLRPEVHTEQMPAPQRIAPYAAALSADVWVDGDGDGTELGTGRIILLHDPAGNDAWDGVFRCVAYARAEIDVELITDPLLADVGWSWLTEALEAHGADFHAVSGTVTRVATESYRGHGRGRRHGTAGDQGVLDADRTGAAGRDARRVAARRSVGGAALHRGRTAAGAGRGDGHPDPTQPRRMTGDSEKSGPAESGAGPEAGTDAGTEAPAEDVPELPLLTLRDGLPPLTDTDIGLRTAATAIAGGTGPVAIDAERASGYRYSSRAYLIQLRREGSGSWLIDPIGLSTLAPLQEALEGNEWILHAATQDLPCLAEVGLTPSALFDTELAGRLLGHPRVGLATLVETVLGYRMKKEHSAVDWSTRPLPAPWLDYAALDVEVLIELRDALHAELVESGKIEWAVEEFDALRGFTPTPRVDAWRRTSGLHRVRGRRGLGAVKELWETRDEIAENRDVTPGRIIPDAAIVVAALTGTTDKAELLGTKGFHGRGAERYASRWVAAIQRAQTMDEADLPVRSPRSDGPPLPRAWAERDPVAARRLVLARAEITALAAENSLPVENLLTPDYLRRVLWTPPETREPEALAAEVAAVLTGFGARQWQVGWPRRSWSQRSCRGRRGCSARTGPVGRLSDD